MGCSFCLPRHRDEPAPVESEKSRRTSASEAARNGTNSSGELAVPEAETQHPDPKRHGKPGRPNDSGAVKGYPPRPCKGSAAGKTAESSPAPAYGIKPDFAAQNATNSSEEVANPEVQAKPVAKHSHPHRDGKTRRQHENEAAHNATSNDGELATGREGSPKPVANHAHPHHFGESRQQNDNVVEKYRLRRHRRGHHMRRPADDTIYEVIGLKMPETDLSDDVPCRLKTASNPPHSSEVPIPYQQQIAANVDP